MSAIACQNIEFLNQPTKISTPENQLPLNCQGKYIQVSIHALFITCHICNLNIYYQGTEM